MSAAATPRRPCASSPSPPASASSRFSRDLRSAVRGSRPQQSPQQPSRRQVLSAREAAHCMHPEHAMQMEAPPGARGYVAQVGAHRQAPGAGGRDVHNGCYVAHEADWQVPERAYRPHEGDGKVHWCVDGDDQQRVLSGSRAYAWDTEPMAAEHGGAQYGPQACEAEPLDRFHHHHHVIEGMRQDMELGIGDLRQELVEVITQMLERTRTEVRAEVTLVRQGVDRIASLDFLTEFRKARKFTEIEVDLTPVLKAIHDIKSEGSGRVLDKVEVSEVLQELRKTRELCDVTKLASEIRETKELVESKFTEIEVDLSPVLNAIQEGKSDEFGKMKDVVMLSEVSRQQAGLSQALAAMGRDLAGEIQRAKKDVDFTVVLDAIRGSQGQDVTRLTAEIRETKALVQSSFVDTGVLRPGVGAYPQEMEPACPGKLDLSEVMDAIRRSRLDIDISHVLGEMSQSRADASTIVDEIKKIKTEVDFQPVLAALSGIRHIHEPADASNQALTQKQLADIMCEISVGHASVRERLQEVELERHNLEARLASAEQHAHDNTHRAVDTHQRLQDMKEELKTAQSDKAMRDLVRMGELRAHKEESSVLEEAVERAKASAASHEMRATMVTRELEERSRSEFRGYLADLNTEASEARHKQECSREVHSLREQLTSKSSEVEGLRGEAAHLRGRLQEAITSIESVQQPAAQENQQLREELAAAQARSADDCEVLSLRAQLDSAKSEARQVHEEANIFQLYASAEVSVLRKAGVELEQHRAKAVQHSQKLEAKVKLVRGEEEARYVEKFESEVQRIRADEVERMREAEVQPLRQVFEAEMQRAQRALHDVQKLNTDMEAAQQHCELQHQKFESQTMDIREQELARHCKSLEAEVQRVREDEVRPLRQKLDTEMARVREEEVRPLQQQLKLKTEIASIMEEKVLQQRLEFELEIQKVRQEAGQPQIDELACLPCQPAFLKPAVGRGCENHTTCRVAGQEDAHVLLDRERSVFELAKAAREQQEVVAQETLNTEADELRRRLQSAESVVGTLRKDATQLQGKLDSCEVQQQDWQEAKRIAEGRHQELERCLRQHGTPS